MTSFPLFENCLWKTKQQQTVLFEVQTSLWTRCNLTTGCTLEVWASSDGLLCTSFTFQTVSFADSDTCKHRRTEWPVPGTSSPSGRVFNVHALFVRLLFNSSLATQGSTMPDDTIWWILVLRGNTDVTKKMKQWIIVTSVWNLCKCSQNSLKRSKALGSAEPNKASVRFSLNTNKMISFWHTSVLIVSLWCYNNPHLPYEEWFKDVEKEANL